LATLMRGGGERENKKERPLKKRGVWGGGTVGQTRPKKEDVPKKKTEHVKAHCPVVHYGKPPTSLLVGESKELTGGRCSPCKRTIKKWGNERKRQSKGWRAKVTTTGG